MKPSAALLLLPWKRLALLPFLLSLSLALPAQADSLAWEKLMDEAQAKSKARDFAGAQSLYQQAIKEAEASKLEEKFVGKSLNDLAVCYEGSASWKEAEDCLLKALSLKEKAYGLDSQFLVTNLGNLAQVYRQEKNYPQAQAALSRAIKIVEGIGKSEPTLTSLYNSLAAVQLETKDYPQAEVTLRHLLELTRALEDKTAQIVTSNNLAVVLRQQGRLEEARTIYLQVVALSVDTGGSAEDLARNKAAALTNLARVERENGQFEAAEPYLKEAVDLLAQNPGQDKSDYITALDNLAMLYRELGRYDDAENLYAQTIKIEEAMGANPERMGIRKTNLAQVYMVRQKYDLAEQLLREVLAGYEKAQGPDGLEVATALTNLEELLREQGKYDQAQVLLSRAYEIRKKMLGADSPKVAATAVDLALLLKEAGNPGQSEKYFQEALKIQEQGKPTLEFAATLNSLGRMYKEAERYPEAEQFYRRALSMKETLLDAGDPSLAATMRNLASVLKAQKRLDEAKELNKRAKAIEAAN